MAAETEEVRAFVKRSGGAIEDVIEDAIEDDAIEDDVIEDDAIEDDAIEDAISDASQGEEGERARRRINKNTIERLYTE